MFYKQHRQEDPRLPYFGARLRNIVAEKRRLFIFCGNISQYCFDGISRKFRAVECCRRKSAKQFRDSLRGKRARLGKRATAKLLRKQRSTRNGRSATTAQKTRFHDPFAFHAHR